MNRLLALVALLLPVHVILGGDTQTEQPKKTDKKQADLKWARGVVEDFWAAGKEGDDAQAKVLLSADLRKATNELRDGDSSYRFSRLQAHGLHSWSIAKQEMSPDQDEAVFQGILKSKSGEAGFSVRVIREKEGRWRIALFRIEEWKKKESKPDK